MGGGGIGRGLVQRYIRNAGFLISQSPEAHFKSPVVQENKLTIQCDPL